MYELDTLLTIVSVVAAVVFGVLTFSRNRKSDSDKSTAEFTTIAVKLENISNDTKDIKSELRSVRTEVGELRERVIVTEQSSKSLHKRVDNFEERLHDMEHPKV